MVRLPVEIMTAGNRNELPSEQFSVDRATADNFGGQIGRAVEGLGAAGMNLASKISANERQLEQFNYEDQFVKLQDADNTDYEQRYRSISGAAEGWWMNSRAATKERMEGWLKTLPENARAEYQVKIDMFIAGRTSQAFKDQFQQQDANTKQTLAEEQRKAGLQVQNNPDVYDQFVRQQTDLIDKSTLPTADKERLKAAAQNELAYTAELTRAQRDPESVAKRAPPVFAPDINAAIDTAAEANGLDPAVLRRFAQIESGGKPGAMAGSYKGLFQLSNEEFAKHGGGNIWSAEDNANAAARKIKAEANEFKAKYGREPTATDLYMQHQQGVGGYAAHLEKPDEPAWQNMLSTAEGKDKGAAWAKAAIWGNIPNDVKAQFPGGVDTVTSSAFVNLWQRKIDGYASATAASGVLTPEQAASVQEVAQRQIIAQEEQRAAQYEAGQAVLRDQLYIRLREGNSPYADLAAARESGLISQYSEIDKAEGIIKAREQADVAHGVGMELMRSPAPGNPFDKKHREGVEAVFDRAVRGGADFASTAASIYDKTKIVPASFATAVRGALVSNDPARVASGLIVAANMLRDNPNAFAGVEGGAELEKSANEYQRLYGVIGMSSDQAARRVIADAQRSPTDVKAAETALSGFVSTELKPEKVRQLTTTAWSSFFQSTASLPPGQHGMAIDGIYKELAKEGFLQFGDTDRALDYAKTEFKKRFGVFNGMVTQYPPGNTGLAKLPETGDNGHGWVSEQAAQEVQKQLGIVVDKSQIIPIPVERTGVSTRAAAYGQPMTVTRDDSADPNQRTKFQSVPYQLVIAPKPGDENSVPTVVPGVFFPDVETYVIERNKKIMAENAVETGAEVITAEPFGAPGVAQPLPQPLMETPAQQDRREQAAAEKRLRASQTETRASREAIQENLRQEVKQREDAIAELDAQLKELDKTSDPITAQTRRNWVEGSIMRLRGEIMQLNKRTERKRK